MEEVIKNSCSINDTSLKLYGYTNSRTINKIKDFISEHSINTTHFDVSIKNRKYEVIEKDCPVCNEKFETRKGHKKEKTVCSIKCSNIFRGPRSQEVKDKISKSINKHINENGPIGVEYVSEIPTQECVICEVVFDKWRKCSGSYTGSKTCSPECSHQLKSNITKERMKYRIENRLHKGWNTRNKLSYPEKFFIKVLKNNGIYEKCEVNYKVKKSELGMDCTSCYFLDFFFEEKKIDLEIDGKQHKIEERKASDDLRDEYLTKNGIKVYRIEWKGVNSKNGKEYIKNEIEKFLDFYKSN
jgi:very-short-patch-repair endonuclease